MNHPSLRLVTGVSVGVVTVAADEMRTRRLINQVFEGGEALVDRMIIVADDGMDRSSLLPISAAVRSRIVVRGAGPTDHAGAFDLGWRAVDTDWVVHLSPGAVLGDDWACRLFLDLARVGHRVGAVAGRPPSTVADATAGQCAIDESLADLAVRRPVMHELGGFRDGGSLVDLARRISDCGLDVAMGRRTAHVTVRYIRLPDRGPDRRTARL